MNSDKWEFELDLQVTGDHLPVTTQEELLVESHGLRTNKIPFDGLSDLAAWLTLRDWRNSSQPSRITLRAARPADIILAKTTLASDKLQVVLLCHPAINRRALALGARVVPGSGLARMQIGQQIKWTRNENGLFEGSATVEAANANGVLLILTLGSQVVRRQWFVDSERASNTRLIAVQAFDRDLRQLKQALLDPTDARRFEKAVASILFLLGFSPAQQVETEAPDIVAATPAGTFIVVECTVKTADLRLKVGKLVDRRSALVTALQNSNQVARVDAFLVCAVPRDQIASEANFLVQQRIGLLTRENIEQALLDVRAPGDPDRLLSRAAEALAAQIPMASP